MLHPNAETLSEAIQRIDFNHPFIVHPGGSLTSHTYSSGIYAPAVYHDETSDVDVQGMTGQDWEALTGFTGQDRYNGAVMHASEVMSPGIADELIRLSEHEPQTFALVVVEVLDDEDDDPEPAGWAIVHLIR